MGTSRPVHKDPYRENWLRRFRRALGHCGPAFTPRRSYRQPPFHDLPPLARDQYMRARTRISLHQFVSFGIAPDGGTLWADKIAWLARGTKRQ